MAQQRWIGHKQILKKLRNEGFRLTRARHSIVDLLATSKAPLSLTDIKKGLEMQEVKADRTTIYREVLFLKGKKMVCEIPIGGGKRGYKVCQDNHHHHLICIRCKKVEPIVFRQGLLGHEKEIFERKHFKVVGHLLEFYGLCGDCQ